MSNIKKINTIEEFNDVLSKESKFLFLKNSTTCPISSDAFNEFTNFAEDLAEVNVYYLNVQEARPLSNEIAERFNIKHESPQAFLFKSGEAIWNASHWNVTYSALKNEWEK